MRSFSVVFSAIVAATLFSAGFSAWADDRAAAGSPGLFKRLLGAPRQCGPCRDADGYESGAQRYPCPPEISPEQPPTVRPGETAEQGEKPGTKAGENPPGGPTPGESDTPPTNALASDFGATSGPLSFAPDMIGDQFGSGMGTSRIIRSFSFGSLMASGARSGNFYTGVGNSQIITQYVALNQGPFVPPNSDVRTTTFPIIDYNDASNRLNQDGAPLSQVPSGGTLAGGTTTANFNAGAPGQDVGTIDFASQFNVAYGVNVPSPGGVVGRLKIADDESPMPRDRLIFDYNFFGGVPLYPGDVDVNRFTAGFEKTFFNRWISFELKAPMAATLDSTIVEGGMTNTSHGEFGNLLLTWKTLLIRHENWAISGGLTVAPPTADNVTVVTTDGIPLIQVLNRGTHLGPYFGFLWTPSDRWFAQGFLQYDVAANGNPVRINLSPDLTSPSLTTVGEIVDTPFQFADVGAGYWVYRGHERFRRMTGWALTAELHWNRSLQETDVVESNGWRIGDFANTVETFDLTIGTHLELYDMTTITCGYCVPLGGGLDREFNGEFRLMVNRRFGAQNRLTRATF